MGLRQPAYSVTSETRPKACVCVTQALLLEGGYIVNDCIYNTHSFHNFFTNKHVHVRETNPSSEMSSLGDYASLTAQEYFNPLWLEEPKIETANILCINKISKHTPNYMIAYNQENVLSFSF